MMRFARSLLLGIAALGFLGPALAGCSSNVRTTPVHYSVGIGVGSPWWGYGPRLSRSALKIYSLSNRALKRRESLSLGPDAIYVYHRASRGGAPYRSVPGSNGGGRACAAGW